MDDSTYNLLCGAVYLVVVLGLIGITVYLPLRELHKEAKLKAALLTWFQGPFAVYLKAPVSWSSRSSFKQRDRWMYVGSTSVSTCKREYNRQSKLKQVLLEQYVQVEPAIRIWASLGTYFDFSTICVSVHQDYREAWIQEHILIDRWQPRFNSRFIDRFYMKSALGFKRLKPRPSLKTVSLFSRLRGKVRRRASTTSTPTKCLMDKEQAWSLLYDLASLTVTSFEAAKIVRSDRVSALELYALFRMAKIMEQPYRSRVVQLLKSALKFRNCTVPRHNSSVTIPVLSHPSFPSQVSSFLSHIIQQFKPILVPFHLPPRTPRECAPRSLGSILYNHFDWEKKLAEIPIEQLPCKCKQFERQHPKDMVDGHVATGLENMSFQDPVLRELAYANSKSLVFLSRSEYVKQASLAFKKWCKTHFVPLEMLSSWTQFIHQQWNIHLRHLRHRPKFHETHVLKMKDIICSDWVVHLADHESTHLMVFCPKFYFQSCHRVWSDEKVFKPMSMSIPAAKLFLCSHVPSDILPGSIHGDSIWMPNYLQGRFF
eukprot:s915_g16.t1